MSYSSSKLTEHYYKKAKKKKVKKDKPEEAAPPAEPEPVPEPTPAPAPEPEPAEGDNWWAGSEDAQEKTATEEGETPAQEEAPPAEQQAEGAEIVDAEMMAEPPPAPKKKPKFFIHWDRRKPKFYDYNFDYGERYYSPIVNYLDSKNLGAHDNIPRRKAFAERGIDLSVYRKSQPDMVTQNLMYNVRNSIRGYEDFQKTYAYDVDRKYFE